MTDVKTYYRPGLRFKAKQGALCHQECCFKGAEEVRNADGTLRTEEIRALWAEFGTYGGEWRPTLDGEEPLNDLFTGEPLVFADIRGGYFDLDAQAEEKDWTDAEKEIVARHMLTMLSKPQAQFTLLEDTKAPAPWPTYDQFPEKNIADFAEAAGVVAEALRYEAQNEKRPKVVAALRAKLAPAAPAEDELVAA